MIKKRNLPLILGLAIPLLMILFVAASIYLPSLFYSPKYNFLYSTDSNYYGEQIYSVNNGKLLKNPITLPPGKYYRSYPTSSQLYLHNTKFNISTPISFANASNLILDPSSESPDGYEIKDGSNNGGFLFFSSYGRDYYTKYIIGHNLSKKLNLKRSGPDYSNRINFIGWIIP